MEHLPNYDAWRLSTPEEDMIPFLPEEKEYDPEMMQEDEDAPDK